MTRRYSSAELTDMANNLAAFRERFQELLEHAEATSHLPVLGSWMVPSEGHQADFERLKGEVSLLAGPAQVGIALTNSFIEVRDEAGVLRQVNSVASWLAVTQPKAIVEPEDVIGAALLAEGKLRADARAAAREERSFAGRVAAVLRFPVRVSDLAGFERSSLKGRTTQWTVGGFMFVIVTGVVVAALWRLLTWLMPGLAS